ncbi:MAG: hypothetical protein Q8L00_13270 [Deltaproteobacteria bacterium]|nr:hypothetical protein [Deltaproteobacteria bacterium]
MRTITLNLLLLLLISSSPIFMGCTYSGAIRTDISPTAMVGRKFPAKVGIYFAPRLEQYEESTNPATYYGSAHTFTFKMGPAIKEALTKSVGTAYSNVSVLSEPPKPGQFDRDISFDLQSSNVQIEFVPKFWTSAAKANAIIHVTMEIMDGSSLKAIQRLTVSGNGFTTQDTSGGGDAQKQFSRAIEDAIRQLAENTANLLISGVAEPK